MPNPLETLRARSGPFWRVIGILAAVLALALLVWKLPQIQVRHTPGVHGDKVFDDENEARKTLAQLLAGTFVLLGLYFSAKTFGLSREGHITDRFTKAIEQLGKSDGTTPNIEVRLGAIYALERIALDSPRDHWTIMEVLTAYVRQNAPLRPEVPYTQGEKPRTDIQAILTVLGRRRTDQNRERPEHILDISNTRLCGAKLGGNFQRAQFYSANLRYAHLIDVNLQRARLWSANLQDTLFINANLCNATLFLAHLQRAQLTNVDLEQTDLAGARFEEAKGLVPRQVKSAKDWRTAHYSPAFRAELGLPPEPEIPSAE